MGIRICYGARMLVTSSICFLVSSLTLREIHILNNHFIYFFTILQLKEFGARDRLLQELRSSDDEGRIYVKKAIVLMR